MSDTKKPIPSSYRWDADQKKVLTDNLKMLGFRNLASLSRFIFNKYIRENNLQ
jgi:hypothetical protein